jgi:hypothetical protein
MKRALMSLLCSLGILVLAPTPAFAQQVGEINGAVKITWNYRGGTCHIIYTEAQEAVYKYRTSAGCDEGSLIVRGLVPGQKYKFQVSPDGVNWSKPVASAAQSYVMASPVVYQSPAVQTAAPTAAVVNMDDTGMVRVVWAQRGGTCWIRYTESDQKMYKYTTAEECDKGEALIGKLVSGRRYRFQISQDGVNWSKATTAVARSLGTTVGVGGVTYTTTATAGVATTTVAAKSAPQDPQTWVAAASIGNASVRMMWAHRGGTCNVIYGEAESAGYAYKTSAGCDEAGVNIGGLVPGKKYKFQVSQDQANNWSRPVYAVAL